jgi:hypothetical protein
VALEESDLAGPTLDTGLSNFNAPTFDIDLTTDRRKQPARGPAPATGRKVDSPLAEIASSMKQEL